MDHLIQLKCVAKTNRESGPCSNSPDHPSTSQGHFKSVQWTTDGTSLITNSADNQIRTFIAPTDLLDDRDQPHSLVPFSTILSHEPVNVVTGYLGFNLQDSATTLILSSIREHPIRLHSALTADLVASYPLVNPMTEEYITPQSLTFTPDGTRFVAGSESLISVFDISRTGEAPMSSLSTGPKSRKVDWFNPSVNMRGIASALAIEPASNVLAAGTFGRNIGLYGAGGLGECLGVFSVEGTEADKQISGRGVTQVLWSPCGRYLYIAERKSDGAMVYDIRKTGQLLSWIEGRRSETNQRLGVDITATDEQGGHEIWAGGMDGKFRMWKDVHQHEGAVKPSFEWSGHGDPVTGVVVHKSGGVVATASGQRHMEAHFEQDGTDNSLKIWSLLQSTK